MASASRSAYKKTTRALGSARAKVVCAIRLSYGLQGKPNSQRVSAPFMCSMSRVLLQAETNRGGVARISGMPQL